MQKKQSEFEKRTQPQVSVVIPAYNQAHYLTTAIESVLAQTFRDFEVLVVDDGSTDETPLVAQQFGSRIRYLRQDNQGLAGARNTGMLAARGDYIALLDSDDQWLPTYLQRMMSLASQHPEAVVYYCAAHCMDGHGKALPQVVGRSPDARRMYWTLLRANFLIPSTVLMRRIEAGLFDVAFRRLQDWEFWLRLLRAGHTFVGCAEPLVRYRLHGSSLSTDPVGGKQAALAIVEKHFGADDGQWHKWSEEKRRAYGGAYRYHALTSLQRQKDWQACTAYLRRALQIDPTLEEDLDLFYELALGTQPLGYRGTEDHLELEENIKHIKKMLADIFYSPVVAKLPLLRRQRAGTAYYALGLAAYNMGDFSRSRHFLLKALRLRPTLLRDAQFRGTLSRSLVGRRALGLIKGLRQWPFRNNL